MERIAHSKAAAELKLKAAILDLGAERSATASITRQTTVGQLADIFIRSVRDAGKAYSTINKYESHLKLIRAELQHVLVGSATTSVIRDFITRTKNDRGYSTAKGCRSVLSGMFALAVADDALLTNPVAGVPRLEQAKGPKGAKPLTSDELGRMLEVLLTDKELQRLDLSELFLFMLLTGCRIGEACGLRWQDTDLDAGRVTFATQPVRVPGEGMRLADQLKTDGSYRTVQIPAQLVEILRKRGERMPANEHGLVFPSVRGHIRDTSNTTADWRQNRGRLGFPEFTSHGFRKSVADMLESAELPLRQISTYLGHADSRTTEKHYLSKTPPTLRQAEIISAIVGINSE